MTTRTLTLEDPDSGLTFAIAFDRWDLVEQRPQWHYTIRGPIGEVLAEGTDLRGGSGDQACEASALASLMSFLSAWAESLEYQTRTGLESDNADMFPESLRPAAEILGSDGFAMLAESLEVSER